MPPRKNTDKQKQVLNKLNDLAPELGSLNGLKPLTSGEYQDEGSNRILRVEYINLLLVYPDSVQPRRILPEGIADGRTLQAVEHRPKS